MLSALDVVVLCGGPGTRLKSVTGESPKALASVSGRPFLEVLFRQLKRHGARRAILAVGYQRDAIRTHFGPGSTGLDLEYSVEASPLGTGGALRNAAGLVQANDVLIMNGDSYTDADLCRFLADYRASGADLSVLVVPADGRIDCGSVGVDAKGKLTDFEEKSGEQRYVNAGVYLARASLLREIPEGRQVSLEKEVFPRWVSEGKDIRAFVWAGSCVDIGTPERYRDAQNLLAGVE
jgi:NDP-sugar pyrophosphorylase family protein